MEISPTHARAIADLAAATGLTTTQLIQLATHALAEHIAATNGKLTLPLHLGQPSPECLHFLHCLPRHTKPHHIRLTGLWS